MYSKKNSEWWNGGWQRRGKGQWVKNDTNNPKTSDYTLDSVTIIEPAHGYWVDGYPEQKKPLDYIDSLFADNGVGIPSEHAVHLQAVAMENNVVFGVRPVERMVTTLIKEGYPTKGFMVKGKSSNWGPQAGFICVDQNLSKKENCPPPEINKLNQAILKGMNCGHYTKADLKISNERIDELIKNFGLDNVGSGSKRLLRAKGPSGSFYEFVAEQENDGLYRIMKQGEQEAIQVLAHAGCDLPMTADYDLFLVATSIEEYGENSQDARPNTAVKYSALPHDIHSADSFYDRESMTQGNITPRTRLLVDKLNRKLGRGEHREMFHHSDDAGSPVSSMRDNFPATFYLPQAMKHQKGGTLVHFDEVCVVSDKETFDVFVECIKDNGYHFNSHPDWKVPQRPSFEQAKAVFDNGTKPKQNPS